jgi:hypothetical protein
MADTPRSSAGASLAPADAVPRHDESAPWGTIPPPESSPKFRPLLSTEQAEWDTEERGCLLPVAVTLLGLLAAFVVGVILIALA